MSIALSACEGQSVSSASPVRGHELVGEQEKRTEDTTNSSPSFEEELNQYLEQLAANNTQDAWQLEQVIRQAEFETTEVVSKVRGPEEPSSPCVLQDAVVKAQYIRKRIDAASGVGSAYEDLWQRQQLEPLPECVPVLYECTKQHGELTVVMEYIEGITLTAFVAALGPGTATANMLMPDLCSAVQQLHNLLPAPLIHRDLKPSNIMIRAGKPVIIDFGCARTWKSVAQTDTTHFLTRCYAPPEQFGFGQTTVRSDVYALGKILYFCLTGENPPNVCDIDACKKVLIPQAYAEVIARACAFDPTIRYASAHELGEAIERAARIPLTLEQLQREEEKFLRSTGAHASTVVRVPEQTQTQEQLSMQVQPDAQHQAQVKQQNQNHPQSKKKHNQT